MKHKLMLTAMVAAMSLGLVLCGVGVVFAKASGPCSDCHTMHNSQNNAPMAYDASGALSATPNSKLLTKATCIGCHTGTNAEGGNIPYVYDSTEPNYGTGAGTGTGTESVATTLAGGNFHWMDAGTDAAGHNVTDLDADGDTLLGTPPGFNNAFNANGMISGGTWSDGTDLLTCAGTNGCHGNHYDTAEITDPFVAVAGGHHGDDATIDGSTVAKSYRFLKGIVGLEDPEWEFTPTSSLHNQYKGVDRANDTVASANANSSTISYLCSECHGDFHSGAAALGTTLADGVGSPWIRHPTDFDLENASGTEYINYNGGTGTGNTYSVVAPVGSVDVSAVKTTVNPATAATDDAIVTCISCHRAHGTPYPDLLRWDYSATLAATGGPNNNTGCFICHTTKD